MITSFSLEWMINCSWFTQSSKIAQDRSSVLIAISSAGRPTWALNWRRPMNSFYLVHLSFNISPLILPDTALDFFMAFRVLLLSHRFFCSCTTSIKRVFPFLSFLYLLQCFQWYSMLVMTFLLSDNLFTQFGPCLHVFPVALYSVAVFFFLIIL